MPVDFDANQFKKDVKEWVRSHPEAGVAELHDFCEELIPPRYFAAHSWLVDQTTQWFRHVLVNREKFPDLESDSFD